VTFSLPASTASAILARMDDVDGDAIWELRIDQTGAVYCYTHAGTLTLDGQGTSPSAPLTAGVLHTLDIAWKQSDRLDVVVDAQAPLHLGLPAYTSALALAWRLRLGVYTIGGDAGTTAQAVLSGWELFDDPDVLPP
jgi:hypothetical protein